MTRMKWPNWWVMVRHDVSGYNILKAIRAKDPQYKEFCAAYSLWAKNPWDRGQRYKNALRLAKLMREKYALNYSDYDTPLAYGGARAVQVGAALRKRKDLGVPDVIHYSPYLRARQTLAKLIEGWPELAGVAQYEEDRIREREHGIATLYNDWKTFHLFHPDQCAYYQQEGPYWYRYPQGENIADVKERRRSQIGTITREFAGKKVLEVTHHETILATRSTLERWTPEKYLEVDDSNKPANCSVTLYRGSPGKGRNGKGKLILDQYNKKYFAAEAEG